MNSPLPRTKRGRRLVVVDTSELVTGISGCKATYASGRNPSSDLLYKWAEGRTFVWHTRRFLDASSVLI